MIRSSLNFRRACRTAAIRLAAVTATATAAVLAVPLAFAAGVSFNINYTYGSTVSAQQQALVTTATNQTFARLASYFDATAPVSINVDFNYFDQGSPNLLGSAGPTNFQLRDGAYIPNALDKFQYGASTTVTDMYDMTVNMNAAQDWDFTFATPADPNKFSYAETLYHEDFHALGFLSSFQQNGSYAFSIPTRWDNNIQGFVNGSWQNMSALTQAQRAAALTGVNTLRYNGANTIAGFGAPVLLYAPTTYEPGSSGGSHTAFGQGLLNMEPSGPPGRYTEPSATEKAMLADIGWRLAPTNGAVPEPGTLALTLTVLLPVLGTVRRRRTRRDKNR